MNVQEELIVAIQEQIASTRLEVTCAIVRMVFLEVEEIALVSNKIQVYQFDKKLLRLVFVNENFFYM